ncbi:hypothetical protein JFX23_08350 [Schaalia cardiffensis]|uniref:hypothetical protein n=1 Tax=Schaalia cardiffensis TaxID=181487 RepID=UPI0018E76637|nr:hypothetical protein [Schaalia cardiffensis]MBJ2329769.1 hypothetical protein [Schaalia cardiffensis]
MESVEIGMGSALAFAAASFVMLPIRAIFVLLALVFTPFRTFLPFLLFGRSTKALERREVQVPLHAFTLERSSTGERIDVILRGELSGGYLALGDLVLVDGRQKRSGIVEARKITNLEKGTRISGREHPAIRRERAQIMAGVFLLVVIILCIASWFLN